VTPTLFGYSLHGLGAAPLAALAAFALAAITALHLLRERRRRVLVSSAVLWSDAAARKRQARLGGRLRRWLSWAIQLLVLVLLLIAAGDPRRAPEPTERTVIVLIDRSASMGARHGDGTRLDVAKREAKRIVAAAPGSAEVLVASFGATAVLEVGADGDRARAEAAIDRILQSDEPSDLPQALRFAGAIGPETRPATIVIVGDGSYDEVEIAREVRPPNDLVFVQAGAPGENAGIVSFGPVPGGGRRAAPDAVLAVQNFGDRTRALVAEIWVDGARAARQELRLAPRARAVRHLPLAGRPGRLWEARLEPAPGEAPDLLALDDRAYAIVSPPRPRTILVVGAPNLYLDAALLGLGEEVTFRRIGAGETAALAGAWEKYDCVIVDGAPLPVAPTRGRFLLLDPHGPGAPFPSRGVVRAPVPTTVDTNHPLLQHASLADLNVRQARRLELEPDDRAPVASFGVPLMITRERPELRLVALAFDVRRSDLPLRPSFPVLVANAVEWLAGAPAVPRTGHLTGSVAAVSSDPSVREAQITGPDGAVTPVRASAGALDVVLSRQGTYRIERSGERGLVAAANLVSPGESDTTRGPPSLLRARRVEPADASPGTSAPLGAWAAFVALALALLEWWAYHRRWVF
jgi:hypothetical protein